MDNAYTLATLRTQDTRRREIKQQQQNTTQKTKKMCNTDSAKIFMQNSSTSFDQITMQSDTILPI
jgi:hypothetical protein